MMIDSKYITKSTILFHYRKKYVILHMAKIKIYDFFLNHFFIKCQISNSQRKTVSIFHISLRQRVVSNFELIVLQINVGEWIVLM